MAKKGLWNSKIHHFLKFQKWYINLCPNEELAGDLGAYQKIRQ